MTTHTSRTALITGASRGLGLALARRLAARGWTLIIDARSGEALEVTRQELAPYAQVTAIAGDVADAAHRAALAAAAYDAGGLDALINNASTLGPSPLPPLLDYPLDALEVVYRTNTLVPLALLQAVRQALKPGARVINVSSDASISAAPQREQEREPDAWLPPCAAAHLPSLPLCARRGRERRGGPG